MKFGSAEAHEPAPRAIRASKFASCPAAPLLFPLDNPLPSWSCMQEQMKSQTLQTVLAELEPDATKTQQKLLAVDVEGSEGLLERLQQAC